MKRTRGPRRPAATLTPMLLLALLACTGPDKTAETARPADTGAPGWGDSASDPGPASALSFDGERPGALLVLTIDTFRRDALGRYGGTETPNLDRLLAEGVALDNHTSCSNWTYPSMLCLLSGNTTVALGFEPLGVNPYEPEPLDEGIPLLSHMLRDLGISNGIVTTNIFLSDDFHTTEGMQQELLDASLDAAGVVDAGLAMVDTLDADRWMLHLHWLDPHDPYDPPQEWLDAAAEPDPIAWDLSTTEGVKELQEALSTLSDADRALVRAHLDWRYAALVRYVDAEIGRLLEALEARGRLEHTLVLLMTDHGEQLLDHGQLGHGLDLYTEETRSVAGFWSPGLAPMAWAGPTSHPDLLPTALDALGWEVDSPMSGALLGDGADDRPIFTQRYQGDFTVMSVRVGDDKLVYDWMEGVTLYDLAADPGEQVDRASEDPERVAELAALLAPQVEALVTLYPEALPTASLP